MTTITLLTGQEVDTSSEEWRSECAQRYEEAKQIAAIRGTLARREYLFGVLKSRGELAHQRLKDEVMRIWEEQNP